MINKVILAGKVSGLKVKVEDDGRLATSFTCLYEEPYGEGHVAKLFVPVDVVTSRAEAIGDAIGDGDLVVIDGRLKWKSWIDKKGEKQGKFAVLAWNVSVLQPATVSRN